MVHKKTLQTEFLFAEQLIRKHNIVYRYRYNCESVRLLFVISDLFRMKDFMKTVPDRKTVEVYLRHATPETYRSVLSEIKNMEIYNMLVDTKSEHVDHFLRGVSQIITFHLHCRLFFLLLLFLVYIPRVLFLYRYYNSKWMITSFIIFLHHL